MDWVDIARKGQKVQIFSRLMFNQERARTLTGTEIEILSFLHLSGRDESPQSISSHMGMKKESLSRYIKTLSQQGLLIKEKNPEDERSYFLRLSPKGLEELRLNYKILLSPYYYLYEKMGEDFLSLVDLTEEATEHLKDYNDLKD